MTNVPDKRRGHVVTALIAVLSIGSALLAAISFAKERLYTPLGTIAATSPEPSFYIGASVYITVAVTCFSSALIRIALRLSR